jgi:large subunit ribosomal protein L16
MLSPKSTKYRKTHRGYLAGTASRGHFVAFGDYGIRATQPSWITSYHLEAGRRVLTRYVRRSGKIWIRVFPHTRITRRPSDTRIGSGKGDPKCWVAAVLPGTMIFEVCGINETTARQAIRIASSKIPFRTQFTKKLFSKRRLFKISNSFYPL